MLNLSVPTIKRHIASGKIPSEKVGNARRIKEENIRNFVDQTPNQKEIIKKDDLKIIPGYMGIKTQILNPIHVEINKIAKKGDTVLDIFAGSGVVGYELKKDFTVYSNDVEPYSHVVNQLLLDNSITKKDIESFDINAFDRNYEKNLQALRSGGKSTFAASEYKKNNVLFPYRLFTEYFSGTYFGESQGQQIDSLRYAIDKAEAKYKNALLSCLIFSCYQTVASVGSHFAQPKINKAKNEGDINKKRLQDVKVHFMKKLNDLKENLYTDKKKNKVFCKDFKDLLDDPKLVKGVAVTYIDPPYTIDHYSRFYHILNTLVLYDYPEKNGIGLYREDRYQSNFCIKTKAKAELDLLIGKISKIGSKVVMSYSDSYRSLLKSDEILEILSKYYKKDSVKNPIKIEYNYSGFGQSAFNKANELLFVATQPK